MQVIFHTPTDDPFGFSNYSIALKVVDGAKVFGTWVELEPGFSEQDFTAAMRTLANEALLLTHPGDRIEFLFNEGGTGPGAARDPFRWKPRPTMEAFIEWAAEA